MIENNVNMNPSTSPNNVTDPSLGVKDTVVDHGDDARPISQRILDEKTGNEGSKGEAEMRNSFTEAKKKNLLCAARNTKNHNVAVDLLKSGLKKSRGQLPKDSEHWSAIEWATYAKNPEALWLLIASSPQSKETKKALGHVGSQADGFSESSDDMAKPNRDNEELIRSILSNPPTGIICDVCKEYDLPKSGGGLPSLGDYKAAVIRFYKEKEQLYRIIKSQSIEETIYDQGPKKIMEDVEVAMTNLAKKLKKRQIGQNITDLNFEASSSTLTWVHLPATNMTWMDDLLQRIMKDEEKSGDEFNQPKSFFKDSWIQISDSISSSRIMRPRFTWRDTNGNSSQGEEPKGQTAVGQVSIENKKKEGTVETPVTETSVTETPVTEPPVARTPVAEIPVAERLATAIYMPYFSYAFQCCEANLNEKHSEKLVKSQHQFGLTTTNTKEPTLPRGPATAPPEAGKSEQDRQREYADTLSEKRKQYETLLDQYKEKVIHGSSTLDESYYHIADDDEESQEDRKRRNETQVMTRSWLKEQALGLYWPLIRANQLWIWTIDDKWLISASSHPIDDSENELLNGILELLEKQGESGGSGLQPSSASEMSELIVNYCVESYERKPRNTHEERPKNCDLDDLSIRQAFSKSINSIARDETNLSEHCGELKKESSSFTDQSENIQGSWLDKKLTDANIEAESLSGKVKDILDELNILESTAQYQQNVQRSLKAMKMAKKQELQRAIKVMKKDDVLETDLTATYVINDIKRLDSVANRVHGAINTILSLQQSEVANLQARLSLQQAKFSIKQTEFSIKQAADSAKQNRVLMVFTVVTIVFLPLSFLTSFFALDVSSFQVPPWIVGVIFSVSIAFVVPTVILAFIPPRSILRFAVNFLRSIATETIRFICYMLKFLETAKKTRTGNGGSNPDPEKGLVQNGGPTQRLIRLQPGA